MPSFVGTPVIVTPMAADRHKLPSDPHGVEILYKNCLDMYQTKKITLSNAFSLKILDCLSELVHSPGFDVTNMQMVGRTLEMGTKIYVCRVDDTYEMVMGLAKRIGVKGKAMERHRRLSEQQREAEDGQEDMELGDNEVDENGEPIFPKDKKKKERKRHKGNFVSSKEKIRMVFPEKVEKYADRQARVREIFTKLKETRQPVPQSEFESPGSAEGAAIGDTSESLSKVQKFPEAFIKSELGCKIQFLQFVWLPSNVVYNQDIYDAWGRSREALAAMQVQEERQNALSQSQRTLSNGGDLHDIGGGGDEYQFDANAVVDYQDDLGAEHFGYNGESEREEEPEGRLPDLSQIKTFAQLKDFYEALRALGETKKLTFSWAGPPFLRNRLGSRTATATSDKRTRTKKVASKVELFEMDWDEETTNFKTMRSGKLEYDDVAMDKLLKSMESSGGPPNLVEDAVDMFEEDEYLDVLSMSSNAHPEVDKFMMLFTDPSWNILKIFDYRLNHNREQSQYSDSSGCSDGMNDYDFEGGPRSQFEEGEDYCSRSQSMIDPDLGGGDQAQLPLTGIMNLETFLSVFPTITHTENAEYEDFMGAVADSEGIKYAKHPKPINMKNLKHTILKILRNKLALDANNQPTEDEDMSTDILSLLIEVFKRADQKTARFLSTSLLFLSLLHVAAEVGLFLEKMDGKLENVSITARGKNWDPKQHIPSLLGRSSIESESNKTRSHGGAEVTLNGHDKQQDKQMEVDVQDVLPNGDDAGGGGSEGAESEKENEMVVDVFQKSMDIDQGVLA